MNSNSRYCDKRGNDLKIDSIQTTSICNLIFSSRNNEYDENYQLDRNFIHEDLIPVSNSKLIYLIIILFYIILSYYHIISF